MTRFERLLLVVLIDLCEGITALGCVIAGASKAEAEKVMRAHSTQLDKKLSSATSDSDDVEKQCYPWRQWLRPTI